MRRRQKRRLVTTLSAITFAGGVGLSGIAGLQIYKLHAAQENIYLPTAQNAWKAQAAVPKQQPAEIPMNGFLGILSIPSIHKSANIFQGTDASTLAKGVGHFIQSVMPGVENNSVLAGHRDTVFAHLGEVKIGDPIVITIQSGTFDYVVKKIRIVDKNDRTVIVPTETAQLTLSTCYPFSYFGDAPRRYIVIAELTTALKTV